MTGLRPIPEGSYLYLTTKRGLTLHYHEYGYFTRCCSSLNLLRFIPSDSFASDSTQNRSHFRGARRGD